MIRLVNQFDPPERQALVATATCCSCCCCCCCLISAVGMTTFTSANMSASAKRRFLPPVTGRTIGAGFALCILLPVIGASVALGSISMDSGGGNALYFALALFAILGGILAVLYWTIHEKHPELAGFLIAAVGSAIAVGEAFLVFFGLISPGGPVVLVFYLILVPVGAWVASELGPRVEWRLPWSR